jgi:hypothetical protein
LALPVLFTVIALAACSTWEQQTYQVLSASKATIDQAAADYNAGTLPQTKEVNAIIAKARVAQTDAVHAFQVYASLKVAKQNAANVAAQQQAVMQAATGLAQLVTDIQALYTKKGSPNGSTPNPSTDSAQ